MMEKKSILRRDTLFVSSPFYSSFFLLLPLRKERDFQLVFFPFPFFFVIFLQNFPSQKHNNKIIFIPLQPIPLRATKKEEKRFSKDSLFANTKGKMPEWSNGADSKSAVRLCCT